MRSFKPSKLEEQDGQIGFDLSNFIPKTHLCMIIQKIVCQLDISSIIATYSPLGQKGISPQMLLSVLFYGYTEGIRSGQALSERCKRDLHYIYLSGGLQPSKTTLNDFRRNHHACLEDLFKQQITILQSLEVVSTTEGHGDGTTIRANANSRRVKTKPQYKKWLLTLKEDVKQIQEEQEALANASNELVKKKKDLR
jgi:transposase